jgi:hypothetical protein
MGARDRTHPLMAVAGPTPAEQLAFLGNVERLLSEGQFVATYKYALLVTLADLAVKYGTDDGRELEMSIRDIAESFIELYWRQCAPYGSGVRDGDGIPIQNTGRQASILTIVGELRRRHTSLAEAQRSASWATAMRNAGRLVTQMPLWRLQRLRNGTLDCLYVRSPRRGHIRLKAGVAANLRRFHGMIVRMAQSEWLRFVQALPGNAALLGPTADLDQFLFGSERAAVLRIAKPLADVQQGLCLYCQRRISAGQVDHFIPWSRYPRDLVHNLVLAHIQCNRDKSDLLAAEPHLERWLRRNDGHQVAIADAGRRAGLVVDAPGAISVAAWAYAHGEQLQTAAWLRGDSVEPLSGRWRKLLASAP